MRPVRTEDTNFVYKLEGGTEENDLPCTLTPIGCLSRWAFDSDDDPIAIGDEPVSDVRVCVAVHGDFETISENLVLRLEPGDEGVFDELELHKVEPQWLEHPDGDMAIAVFPMDDSHRVAIAQDGTVDLFIGARPIPPVNVWTARIGPCERCGKTALHPCHCEVTS